MADENQEEQQGYIARSALPHSHWLDLVMHIVVGTIIGVLFAGMLAGLGVAVEWTTPAISSIQNQQLTWQLGLWTVIGMGFSHKYLGYP
jgi:hypothetical protein